MNKKPISIIPEIIQFYDLVKQYGKLYLVGGFVRDSLIGRTPYDYDFIFYGNTKKLKELFSFFIPSVHNDETVMVNYKGLELQITFPKINLEEELKRRDFTINSIAYSFEDNTVFDPENGINDINKKLIRISDSSGKGIVNDPIRILRAYRLKNKLGFNIDSFSESVIRDNIYLLSNIQTIRIGKEIEKVLNYEVPSRFFYDIRDKSILPFVFPELAATVGVEQNRYHKYDVFSHTMLVLDATPLDLKVRFAALFHDLGKPFVKSWNREKNDFTFYNHEILSEKICKNVLKTWAINLDIRKSVLKLVRNHMFYHHEEWTDKTVRKFIARVGSENIDLIFHLRMADRTGTGSQKSYDNLEILKLRVEKELSKNGELTVDDLDISGYDIMNLGLKGKEIGDAKKFLLDKVMENPDENHKNKLVALLEKKY